jgi:uncharacterized membrane protein
MGFVDETIIVSVDVADAYSLWLDYEQYPRFMEDIDEVTVVGYRRLRWRGAVCGETLEWESDVVDHIEDTRLRWRALDGRETGDVDFQKLDHRETLVHFQLEYETSAWGVDPACLEECLRARVGNALRAFKELAESVAA